MLFVFLRLVGVTLLLSITDCLQYSHFGVLRHYLAIPLPCSCLYRPKLQLAFVLVHGGLVVVVLAWEKYSKLMISLANLKLGKIRN